MSVNKLLVLIGKLIDFILRCPLNLWIICKFILEVVNWIRVFFTEIQNDAEWTERFIRCIETKPAIYNKMLKDIQTEA
jgi:hypothetical protein